MNAALAQFDGHKYVSLETFRKNGQGVPAPVWFVRHDSALYVYTPADSWKIKRIQHTPRVRVALCNVRGTLRGPWIEATASIVEGEERRMANALLNRKYFLKAVANFFQSEASRRNRAMIKITPA